jgi:replicative DNA helicase
VGTVEELPPVEQVPAAALAPPEEQGAEAEPVDPVAPATNPEVHAVETTSALGTPVDDAGGEPAAPTDGFTPADTTARKADDDRERESLAYDDRRIGLADLNVIPRDLPATDRENESRGRHLDGATFVFSVPENVPALWGEGPQVAWAEGEGLLLVGPDGVGKTTLGQQLILARIGLRRRLLGLPVEKAIGRVLYIAADRPRQAASSLRRMADEGDEDVLRERLVVWRGPLPIDITARPQAFHQWVLFEFGEISDVFVDSLKDLAPDLAKDETGGRVNMAFQELIANQIELVVFHHQRKEMTGAAKPKRLADVYGSRWLSAGMGSVILLWGEPGDLIVDLAHLKQPVEPIGPLQVTHDHERGSSTVIEATDLRTLLRGAQHGLTVADAARLIFGEEAPERNQIERARRKLERLVKTGDALRKDDPDGLARYFIAGERETGA